MKHKPESFGTLNDKSAHMLVSYYRPIRLKPKKLDSLLAAGWFRSSAGLFRARSICLEGELCTVVNIRIKASDHQKSKRLRRIANKNKNFRVEIAPLKVCKAMEDLYVNSRSKFKGFIFNDIHYFLNDSLGNNPFNSWHIKVYSGDKLIAASLFDLGEKSMMSVLGLYDKDYKEFSPGIYTMLLELEYCRNHGIEYYYPGFILEEKDYFDYKLALGKCRFLKENLRWVSTKEKATEGSLNKLIRKKGQELEDRLKSEKIAAQKLMYKYYAFAYVHPDSDYYPFPMAFVLEKKDKKHWKLLAYDHNTGQSRIDLVQVMDDPYRAMDMHRPKGDSRDNSFNNLLVIVEHLGAGSIQEIMLSGLLNDTFEKNSVLKLGS